MKNLSLIEKLFFFGNSIAAFLFLVSLLLPFINPLLFPYLSTLSLLTPFLIFLNFLFVFFWVTKLKKHFLLSMLILLMGYGFVLNFINFSNNSLFAGKNNISVMSYNVRLFNKYNWIDKVNVGNQINSFLISQDPDIICLQEFQDNIIELSSHPYRFKFTKGNNFNYGQAIFSKFPIVSKGSIDLGSNSNNAIFVDIQVNNDTIRFYNIHLQSFSINEKIDLSSENLTKNKKLVSTISQTFIDQSKQSELITQNMKKSPYKIVLSGDFNNTAFSYIYRKMIENLKDSFSEKGNGLGITFNYNFIPLRIDFILIDDDFKVNKFKTFNINLSDHEPIYSELCY
tara:strand:- start:10054 stop:11076 length:1023 start_codon:yes stop_codon:yes gene_type:complete